MKHERCRAQQLARGGALAAHANDLRTRLDAAGAHLGASDIAGNQDLAPHLLGGAVDVLHHLLPGLLAVVGAVDAG